MLLAQQAARPLVRFTLDPLFQEQGIPLAMIGMLVVFLALALMIVFITLLPHILARVAATPPEPPESSLAADDELSEEILVVIAAAVAEAMNVPHRIVHIQGRTHDDFGWSLKGRIQHHQSHAIKHRDGR